MKASTRLFIERAEKEILQPVVHIEHNPKVSRRECGCQECEYEQAMLDEYEEKE